MKATNLLAATILMLIVSTSTFAQASGRGDRARVRQGIKSGEMTKGETMSVLKSKREIKKDVRAARADGVVTARERKEIRNDKRKLNRKIYRVKHNNRKRN
jgi:hypothetical protein